MLRSKIAYFVSLLTCLCCTTLSAISIPSFLDDIATGHLSQDAHKNVTMPDPYNLQPQWWHYFDEEGPELVERVTKTVQHLQTLSHSLSNSDQEGVIPLINSISTSLLALPAARSEKIQTTSTSNVAHQLYTLQQQLQLYHQKRKLQLELKTDQGELEQLKERIAKTHQRIDSRLATYLAAESKQTPARLLSGLEIIAQRAALGIAEENRRLLQMRIDSHQTVLTQLENELERAKSALDVSQYDESKLQNDIQLAQSTFEKTQMEFSRAEANLLGVHGRGVQERATKHLLSQKVLHASVNEALAWSNLAFQKLSYNLIMHVNQRFEVDHSDMRKRLGLWKEHLNETILHQKEWEKLALQEQDRVRQDHGILIANNENVDANLLRVNQEYRRVTQETLAMLQHLDENIANVQWLVDQLEHYIRAESGFLERWSGDFAQYTAMFRQRLERTLNVSLFKIIDIPITPLTLIRIVLIFVIAFAFSFILRTALSLYGKRRLDIEESTFYNVGRLAHYFILFIGAIVALCSIGLDFNHVMLLVGALTFGIGFGLQSVAMNFFCGLKILFERKIKVGDHIELQTGHKGKVTEIHVQNTVIYTPDGIEVVIPNSELLSTPLVNWTMNDDYRRLHIHFCVSFNSDKELVRSVVSEAAKNVPCTLLDSKFGNPQVWLVKFGDDALEFELVVWVNYKIKSYTESKEADYLWEIETALRKHKIELPTSQHIIYLKNTRTHESEVRIQNSEG